MYEIRFGENARLPICANAQSRNKERGRERVRWSKYYEIYMLAFRPRCRQDIHSIAGPSIITSKMHIPIIQSIAAVELYFSVTVEWEIEWCHTASHRHYASSITYDAALAWSVLPPACQQ